MHGTAQPVDREASARVARRVRARYRRCWHNAATAVHHLGDGALYVEGWAVVHSRDPYVIEHGWCEVDGRIVDPSYTPNVSPFEPPLAYFAGLRFDADEAAAAMSRCELPLAWLDTHDRYERAFQAAWRDAARRWGQPSLPKTRVVNCRRKPCDVFIGRPSKWRNPFHIGPDGTRAEVIAKFRHWLIRQPMLLLEVRTLRGKVLGCDCAPRPCHGDVLAELADLAGSAES